MTWPSHGRPRTIICRRGSACRDLTSRDREVLLSGVSLAPLPVEVPLAKAGMALSVDRVKSNPELWSRLRAIPEVEDIVSGEDGIWLICRSHAAKEVVEEMAATVLRTYGEEGSGVPVRTAVPTGPGQAGRIRFLGAERFEEPEVRVRFRIALYWGGSRVWGEATGEKGEVLELRTAAHATLAAIEIATNQRLDVRLAGVKRVRVFDAELMVVSLSRPGPGAQRFVGAVVIGKDLWRAAALAVLHALNRTLGNILATR